MSSQARSSSSGVRDLRAMFENKNESTNESSSDRGRSPSGASTSRSPSARKIRSSFISVEPSGTMDGISERRESFSGSKARDGSDTNEAKSSVIDELKQRQNRGRTTKAVPDEAISTPGMPLPNAPQPMDNPDKIVSATQDQEASLKPADLKSKAAVSGGAALKKRPSTTSDKGPSQPNGGAARAKPAAISTSRPSGPTTKSTSSKSSPKTPIVAIKPTTSKAPRQSTAGSTGTTNRPSRPSITSSTNSPPNSKSTKPRSPTRPVNLPSYLTKPTASSAAKHDSDQKDQKTASKEGARGTTKPVHVPSRLMAGTASSNAKHEEDKPPTKTSSSKRTSMVGPATKPRVSLAGAKSGRPSDVTSKDTQAEKKTTTPASGDFLARMMRPTASSANHTATAAKSEEMDKSKSSASTRTSQGSDKASKSTSKPIAKSTDSSKKQPRASTTAAKGDEPSTTQKIENQVKEKAAQAAAAVQDKLPSTKSGNPEQGAQDSIASSPRKTEEPTLPNESVNVSDSLKPKIQIASSASPEVISKDSELLDAPQPNTPAQAAKPEQPAVPTSTPGLPSSPSAGKASPKKNKKKALPSSSPAMTTALPALSSYSNFTDGNTDQELPKPMKLTQPPGEASQATVTEATASSKAETKPEVGPQIPPVALTSQKDEPTSLSSQHDGTVTASDTAQLSISPAPASTDPNIASVPIPPKPTQSGGPTAVSNDDREAQQLREMINSAIAKPDAPVSATEHVGEEQAIEEKHKEVTPEPGNDVRELERTPAMGDGEIR